MAFGNVEQNFDEDGIREDERNKVLEEFLRELSMEEFHCMETPYAVVKKVHEIVAELRQQTKERV